MAGEVTKRTRQEWVRLIVGAFLVVGTVTFCLALVVLVIKGNLGGSFARVDTGAAKHHHHHRAAPGVLADVGVAVYYGGGLGFVAACFVAALFVARGGRKGVGGVAESRTLAPARPWPGNHVAGSHPRRVGGQP